jgi:hypothetical protein
MATEEQTARLLEILDRLPDDEARDWFEALVTMSAEEVGGDLDKAVDMAEELYKDHPRPPEENGG